MVMFVVICCNFKSNKFARNIYSRDVLFVAEVRLRLAVSMLVVSLHHLIVQNSRNITVSLCSLFVLSALYVESYGDILKAKLS